MAHIRGLAGPKHQGKLVKRCFEQLGAKGNQVTIPELLILDETAKVKTELQSVPTCLRRIFRFFIMSALHLR